MPVTAILIPVGMFVASLLRGVRTSSLLVACYVLLSDHAVCDAEQTQGSASVQTIDWQTSPLDLDLRGMNGERYQFHCPPGKPIASRVAGSGPYTDDSSICTAAVHAGALHAKSGGEVTIEVRPGQTTYTGSEQNYITSVSYDGAWTGSFIVIKTDTETIQSPSN